MRSAKMVAIIALALGLTANVANADFTFNEPTNLGTTINSSAADRMPSVSADSLSLYFSSYRPGGHGGDDIWVTRRATIDDDWGSPENLAPRINTPSNDSHPSISLDGLTLFFSSNRPGGYGDDIWVTTRSATSEPWSEPINLGLTVNSSSRDLGPCISADGLELFFHSTRFGGQGDQDIWVTTRTTTSDPWAEPVNLGPGLNGPAADAGPDISADGLMLFFRSQGGDTYGLGDIWFLRRATVEDDWDMPVHPGPPVNTSAWDSQPNVSADGSILYFQSTRAGGLGGYDLWQVSIEPVVDLNGDGIVDSADMCIIVDHWGTDEPLCDIGPMPWGDGIVDVQDLIVLAEHLFEDVNDPTLVAHWALDEIEGDIASDSANDNDGTVYGDPAWQPEGGMVDGALQLDGIDDYVNTPFVLNPADGKFSIFVWVKGGAPGQAVLSQMGGANWLCTDSLEGNLLTELRGLGRDASELLSQTIITDGNWHRVGFVWDGGDRALYVNDILVAEDSQTGLASSVGGLKIGCGSGPTAGTFFSGLIDDVRIYNRAMTP